MYNERKVKSTDKRGNSTKEKELDGNMVNVQGQAFKKVKEISKNGGRDLSKIQDLVANQLDVQFNNKDEDGVLLL